MNTNGSATWLIIFLCAILMFFGWLAINGQHLKQINNLNNQINELTTKKEEIEKLKNEEIDKLKQAADQQSTALAESKDNSTNSANLKSKTATPSGEKE